MKTTSQKIILTSLISIILLSCSTPKKTLENKKIEIKNDITTTLDTDHTNITKLKKLTNQIQATTDKTTTNIKIYNPPDSTGKTSLKAEINIQNNISTTDTSKTTIDSTQATQTQKKETLIDKTEIKTKTKEKARLNWIQKTLIYSGIAAIIIFIIWIARIIIKRRI